MLAVDDLVRALATFRPPPDAQQRQAVDAPASAGLFIVAGPGTGKTASLTQPILKLVLVDGVPPRGILATTFTKRAAEELRSRVLGWGFQIIDPLKNDQLLSTEQRAFVDAVDFNQVRTSVFTRGRLGRTYLDPMMRGGRDWQSSLESVANSAAVS